MSIAKMFSIVGFPFVKAVLLLLASCKHRSQHFLMIANGITVKQENLVPCPPFPHINLQKVSLSVEKSLCSLQF
jgi:hypothetical protein